MPRRTADLRAAEFRQRLAADGFLFLPLSAEFVDQRHRASPHIPAIKRGRGIDRRATLAALHKARAETEARAAAVDAKRAERERIAGLIAPQALSPCRADLNGPAAIAQLADDFLMGCTSSEGISFKSLINKGWRAAQLRTYADEARSVADRRQTELQQPKAHVHHTGWLASVAGVVAFREDLGGIKRAAIGIDLSSVRSAPFEEHLGVYRDLLKRCVLILKAFERGVHPFEPMFVIGLELGIDFEPARPIFFAHPGHGHRDLLHHNKSPLLTSMGI